MQAENAADRVARKEQAAQVMDVLDRDPEIVQEDIVDTAEVGEQPGDTTGVVEEVIPVQEVRESKEDKCEAGS